MDVSFDGFEQIEIPEEHLVKAFFKQNVGKTFKFSLTREHEQLHGEEGVLIGTYDRYDSIYLIFSVPNDHGYHWDLDGETHTAKAGRFDRFGVNRKDIVPYGMTLYIQTSEKKKSGDRFPHRCPRCGSAAYIGFVKTECAGGCQ